MIIMRQLPVPRVYEPIKPEKRQAIRGIKKYSN